MEYVNLGASGLQVARLGLGTIPFGTTLDEGACRRLVDVYADRGGNLIDTANLYGGGGIGTNRQMAGTAERAVARALKGRRDQFVVATKGYWLMEDEVTPNSVGLSRAYLVKNLEASLRRLETDYIDLYQCHNWDPYTPTEETLRVLDDFVRAGKVRYAGVSNWDGWHVVKAGQLARQHGWTPIVSDQVWYNLADRTAEHAIVPACRDQQVSIIVWGALAEGFLTGAYHRGMAEPPAGAKFWVAKEEEMFSWKRLATERNWKVVEALVGMARERDLSPAQVALRWLMDAGSCDVALVGADGPEQLAENLAVMDFRLSEDEVRRLREVSEPPHPYPVNFYDIFCRRESPFYGGLR